MHKSKKVSYRKTKKKISDFLSAGTNLTEDWISYKFKLGAWVCHPYLPTPEAFGWKWVWMATECPKGLTNLSLLSVPCFCVWHNFTCQPTSFSRSDHSSAPNAVAVSSADGNERSFGVACSSWPLAGSPLLQLTPTLGQSTHPVLSFLLPIHIRQLLGAAAFVPYSVLGVFIFALYSLDRCHLSFRFL